MIVAAVLISVKVASGILGGGLKREVIDRIPQRILIDYLLDPVSILFNKVSHQINHSGLLPLCALPQIFEKFILK
jgi:hypothetical protein